MSNVNTLEDLREKLNLAVLDNIHDLSNRIIVNISQHLDEIIVTEQRRKEKERREKSIEKI